MQRIGLFVPALIAFLAISTLNGARQWRQVETPHFRVFSECGERESKRVALEFERFRSMFSQVFNLQLDEGVRLDIFLFRDRKSFDQYSIRHDGKAVGVSGYFSSGPWENMIAMVQGWTRDFTLRTVFHEYTHYLVRKLDWPLWLNEGVAEFYSTFDAENKEVTLGAPITEHVLLLREHTLMPMEVLSSAGEMGHFYENDSQVHLFYAQAWALVHLFQFTEDTNLRNRFRSFLARIKTPSADPAKAFSLVFGDYPLEKELRSYVRQRAYMVSKVESETGVNLETSIREIPEALAVAHLGRLALQMNRPVEADEHFRRALRKEADLPEALEGLARIALSKQKFEEAEALLAKVVEQRPDDFLPHWLLIYSLWGNHLGGPELRSNAERIIAECDQLIRINSAFSEAYYRLAEMSLYSRRSTELAIQRTAEGLQLFPRDSQLRLLHAQLLIASGDSAAARPHLENVQTGGSEPALRSEAEELLRSVDAFAQVSASKTASDNAAEVIDEIGAAPDSREAAPAERPNLRRSRLAEEGSREISQKNVEGPSSQDATAAEGGAEELVPYSRSNCSPAFVSVQGVPRVSGVLTEVICSGDQAVYVVSAQGKRLRLGAALSTPVIFSCEVEMKDFSCGPMQRPVVAYYVPGSAEPFDARAVAIEIKAQ